MGTIGGDTPASALGVAQRDPSKPARGPQSMRPNRELKPPTAKDEDVVEPDVVDEAAGRGRAIGSQAPARSR